MVIRTHGGKEHLMGTAELSMRDALSARPRVVGLVEGQRVGLRANATQRRDDPRTLHVGLDRRYLTGPRQPYIDGLAQLFVNAGGVLLPRLMAARAGR